MASGHAGWCPASCTALKGDAGKATAAALPSEAAALTVPA